MHTLVTRGPWGPLGPFKLRPTTIGLPIVPGPEFHVDWLHGLQMRAVDESIFRDNYYYSDRREDFAWTPWGYGEQDSVYGFVTIFGRDTDFTNSHTLMNTILHETIHVSTPDSLEDRFVNQYTEDSYEQMVGEAASALISIGERYYHNAR